MHIRSVATIQKGVDVPEDKYLNGNSAKKKIDIEADDRSAEYQVVDEIENLPF